jgi:hypothetical protein
MKQIVETGGMSTGKRWLDLVCFIFGFAISVGCWWKLSRNRVVEAGGSVFLLFLFLGSINGLGRLLIMVFVLIEIALRGLTKLFFTRH